MTKRLLAIGCAVTLLFLSAAVRGQTARPATVQPPRRAVPAPAPPPANTQSSAAAQRALLDRYCVGCHSQRAKTAGQEAARKLTLDDLDPGRVSEHPAKWELVVRKLGYTVVRSDATAEPVVYDVPVETRLIPEGRFEAGVCVGVRTRLEVMTAEGVVATASIEQRMFRPGDVEHMVWEVQGTPRNRIRVERLDSAEATAGNLFNRIPDIIDAPPGIVPVTELGPLMSSAARWPTSPA